MNETTVIPLFKFDLPFVICALSSRSKIIIFDNFEQSHSNIANCHCLTLAKFTRQQLTIILDDVHSPLSLSTIVLIGIYENTDELIFTRLNDCQNLFNEYCFDGCIDTCLIKKISNDTCISLGQPIQNLLAAVVDTKYCLVSANSEGQLCIGRDGFIFLTDLIVQYNSQTNEIFYCKHQSEYIFNGEYIDLFEIERELECLPCIRKVWVTIVSHENQDHIGAVYQVDDNAAALQNISWIERLKTYAKICQPSYLVPSLWARVESNVNDRNILTNILHTANNVNKKNDDEASFSFEYKIQRLVQNILNLDHLPDLYEDFFPERQIYTVSSHRLVQALQQERSDYTHGHLFEHRRLQDVIDYLRYYEQ